MKAQIADWEHYRGALFRRGPFTDRLEKTKSLLQYKTCARPEKNNLKNGSGLISERLFMV